MDYKVDPNRIMNARYTGISVRALMLDGRWDNADIAYLDKESLLAWLRSRGGNNEWAENVVGILLGHGNLHTKEDK
jgi:hypothetical protein